MATVARIPARAKSIRQPRRDGFPVPSIGRGLERLRVEKRRGRERRNAIRNASKNIFFQLCVFDT